MEAWTLPLKGPDKEIAVMAASIVYGNEGKAYFSMGEAAKIINWDKNRLGADLADAGVLVTASGDAGNGKKISAYALAEFMYHNRISPLRGRKGAT